MLFYMKTASDHERRLLQTYGDKYLSFQLYIFGTIVITVAVYCTSPLVIDKQLPADTWYPFDIDGTALKTLIFAHQSFVIFDVGFTLVIDCIIASLFWYAEVRLVILGGKFERVESNEQLRVCVTEHQSIIE